MSSEASQQMMGLLQELACVGSVSVVVWKFASKIKEVAEAKRNGDGK